LQDAAKDTNNILEIFNYSSIKNMFKIY